MLKYFNYDQIVHRLSINAAEKLLKLIKNEIEKLEKVYAEIIGTNDGKGNERDN